MMISLEYLAGLVDGEGCVTLFRSHNPECLPDNFTYTAMLQVGMTHHRVVRMLQAQWGGFIGHKAPSDGIRKSYSVWNVKGERCVELLRSLLPFLIVKRAEAECLIAYWADREARLPGRTLKNKPAEFRAATMARREFYRLALQALKRADSPVWNESEFGENPTPAMEGQSRAKQFKLVA